MAVVVTSVSDQSERPFAEQIAELLPRLRRFAYGLTRSRADADDLVQSALERAVARIEQWEPGTRLDSWLFRIVQNLWIDERRAQRRRGLEVGGEELLEMVGDDGRTTVERQLMLDDTQRALQSLPDEQRAVVLLVSVEGLSYAQAADVLAVPVGTVMSRLARGRKAIASAVLGAAHAGDAIDG